MNQQSSIKKCLGKVLNIAKKNEIFERVWNEKQDFTPFTVLVDCLFGKEAKISI